MRNPNKVIQLMVFLACFLGLSVSRAADADPVAMLQNVTAQVLNELKNKQADVQKNPALPREIMERIMLPHVDMEGMARWVVGRTAWTAASPADQAQFTDQFRHLIINTYAGALSAYRNQTIEYLPIRGDAADAKDRVQVSSLIHEPGQEDLNVIYRLVQKDGEWKVYDIVIEGVSLLKGFQAQFANDIQLKGLPQVTEELKEHNKNQKNQPVTPSIKKK